METNIFLIGMMGVGKSTIGRLLSEKNNIFFCDLDREIEKIVDMTMQEIFEIYGEERFRIMESKLFKECTKSNNHIYATGGGIVLNNNNQYILKNLGVTFFLDCSINTINERIKDELDKRPLIKNNNQETISTLYQIRYPLYKSSAHYIINTDSLTPNEVINKIQSHLNE